MEQVYRRQLLALGRIEGARNEVDSQIREFVRGVLAGPLASRPHTQGVQDVLSSGGAAADAVTHFANAFHAAVWDSPASESTVKGLSR